MKKRKGQYAKEREWEKVKGRERKELKENRKGRQGGGGRAREKKKVNLKVILFY